MGRKVKNIGQFRLRVSEKILLKKGAKVAASRIRSIVCNHNYKMSEKKLQETKSKVLYIHE